MHSMSSCVTITPTNAPLVIWTTDATDVCEAEQHTESGRTTWWPLNRSRPKALSPIDRVGKCPAAQTVAVALRPSHASGTHPALFQGHKGGTRHCRTKARRWLGAT